MKRFVIFNAVDEAPDKKNVKTKFSLCVDRICGLSETEGGCLIRFIDADEEATVFKVEGTVEDIVAKIHEAQKGE